MTQIDQDKVEISCAPKNKTHIPSIHSAIGNLQKDCVLIESGKSIKLTSLDYETRTIRQTDIMLNNFIFAKQQEKVSVICLNESLAVLNNKAVTSKSLQTLTINNPDGFTLETRTGKVTATSHREHFNFDLFNDHQTYFTNIKNDKT